RQQAQVEDDELLGSVSPHRRAHPILAAEPNGPTPQIICGGFRRLTHASAGARGTGILTAVIDRDQVLHVARLARLALSEEEVETMASELSGILEHVDRISELDLDGVEPTEHVVDLENVLRPDKPR